MDGPRAAHREMVDPENRYILGTFNPRVIACARISYLRADELDIPEKKDAILDYLLSTAGLDGRAREALRDTVAGRPQPVVAVASHGPGNPPSDGRGGRATW